MMHDLVIEMFAIFFALHQHEKIPVKLFLENQQINDTITISNNDKVQEYRKKNRLIIPLAFCRCRRIATFK